jgi:hypothetical protein
MPEQRPHDQRRHGRAVPGPTRFRRYRVPQTTRRFRVERDDEQPEPARQDRRDECAPGPTLWPVTR